MPTITQRPTTYTTTLHTRQSATMMEIIHHRCAKMMVLASPYIAIRSRTWLVLLVLVAAATSHLGYAAAATAGSRSWSRLYIDKNSGNGTSLPTVATSTPQHPDDDQQHANIASSNPLSLWLLPRGGTAAISTKRGKSQDEEKKQESSSSAQDSTPPPARPPPRRLWLLGSKQSSDNKAEQEKADNDEGKNPSKEDEKKTSWSMFGRNASNSSSSTKQRRKGGVEILQLKSNQKKKETKTDKPQKTDQSTTTANSPPPPPSTPPATTDKKTTTSPPSSTTNTSTVDSSHSEESLSTSNNSSTTAAPEQASPIIVLGAPGGTGGPPYRIIRGGPRQGSSSSSSGGIMIPGGVPGGRGGPVSQNTVILAEILANLLGTALRLWFITFVTRRLATQEETIHAVQHFVWERLNDVYVRDVAALQTIVQEPPLGVGRWWWKRRHVRLAQGPSFQPPTRHLSETFTRTVVVFTVQSNDKGGLDLEFLASVVTFLLTQHRAHAFGTRPTPPPPPGYHMRKRQSATTDEDDAWPPPPSPMELEVVMLVQSPGGAVTTYGLAAAQVRRLSQEAGISVTVCVDKYAASGGYMIASQAHKLIAAPFATIGSVGVIMEGLNFYELARRYGIQPVILKAGESKNPLSLYGPISKQDERIEKQRLEKVHQAFKELIVEGRPALASRLGMVADGSIFLGQEALEVDLVDQVQTSDEYILERIQAGDRVLKLHKSMQPRLSRRFLSPNISPLDLLPHLRSWISQQVQLPLGGGDDIVSSAAENGHYAPAPRPVGAKSKTGLIIAVTGLWSIAQFWIQRVNVPVQE
jgi:signal peptide peptidase SppA